MSGTLVYHDGEAGWYLSKQATDRAKRVAERVKAISAELEEICEDMGWEGFTLNFKGRGQGRGLNLDVLCVSCAEEGC